MGSGVGGYIVKDHPIEYRKAYYKQNKEKINKYQYDYYRQNKAKLQKKSRDYYTKKDEDGLTYYQRNKERFREYQIAYREAKKMEKALSKNEEINISI